MKFVICVAVVLISSVSGLGWRARREREPDAACRNVYEQIERIMRRPAFHYLIQDGELSLDCSEQALTKADECQNASFLNSIMFKGTQLNTAMKVFCRHRTDIEAEPACFTSYELTMAVASCFGEDRHAFALCAEGDVANLTECSATAGAIFRELILNVFD